MVNVTINGKNYTVDENKTINKICEEIKIFIPKLCFLKGINEINACRICVVEIEGLDELVPSCTTYPNEGMVIYTHSKKVLDARKNQMKFLLANHNYDCAICPKDKSCILRKTAEDLGISNNPYGQKFLPYTWNKKSPLLRDNTKCIKCGRCVSICEKIEGMNIWGYVGKGKNLKIDVKNGKKWEDINCALCGQCIVNCPTNALSSREDIDILIDAINDKNKKVVIQVAPAVRFAWAERLGLSHSEATTKKMVSAIKALGVDYVFDTNFSADLTIMEEGTELFEFIKNRKNKFPMFTSCCPGWVRFMKIKHPDFVHQLSTSKSPQQMFGAITKTYFAEKINTNPKDIFCVSIMPCVAKKYECDVEEVNVSKEYKDVDLSITTRELDKLIKMFGIDVFNIQESEFDSPLGEGTGAAVIFGTTGGVMEAALRTAYYLTYKKNPDTNAFKVVRGDDDIRYASVNLDGLEVKAAVVYGLRAVDKLIKDIKSGKIELDFVEVMTCPEGCINGGGQPEKASDDVVNIRKENTYEYDENSTIRFSHENKEVQVLYKDFLGKPLSEKSEELLHTNQEIWSLKWEK